MADRYCFIAIVSGIPKSPIGRVYYYEKAYNMNPYTILYFNRLLQTYIINYVQTKDSIWIEKADDLLTKGYGIHKNRFLYWFSKGIFFQILNVPSLAIYNYQKAEELDPFNYEVKANMSLSYKMAGKIKESEEKQKEANLILPRKEK